MSKQTITSKVYVWPDGSTHLNKPFKRIIPAPKGIAFFLVKMRYWFKVYKQINIDIHFEGDKIVKVQPYLLFKKIGNGKLPKQ